MRADIVPGATFPDYRLPDHTGTERQLSQLQGGDPMIPHTLVLGPELTVHTVYCGYYFGGRPSAAELWVDLREVFRAVKDDFDPTTAPARARWAEQQEEQP